MIDIEKERGAFEIANANSLQDSAWLEIWFDGRWYCHQETALICVQTFCSDLNRDFGLWIQCAESKQAEIEDLKSQLEQAKADTKRIDFLADKSQCVANVMLPTEIVERNVESLRDAIDEAMMIKESESE